MKLDRCEELQHGEHLIDKEEGAAYVFQFIQHIHKNKGITRTVNITPLGTDNCLYTFPIEDFCNRFEVYV